MIHVKYVAAGVLALSLLAATGFVAGPAEGGQFSAVPFDRTITTGLTGVDIEKARSGGYVVPRGEVFYSQYEYVVGYYGIESLASGLATATETGQFGQPLAVFVTDLAGTQPRLTDEGFLVLESSLSRNWVRASEAAFVVGSPARTPGGPAVLPFSSREAASRFVDRYGGEVVGWETVRARLAGGRDDPAARLDDRIRERQAFADETVADARGLTDRPVSVVVGEDAPTLAAAVERAPANTTVRVPPGTYEVNLTVRKPLTIRGSGEGTVLDGGGDGTVLTVRSPRVAVTDLQIAGVGDTVLGNRSDGGGDAWDRRIRLVYGRGDAALRLADAHGSLVQNVTVETPSNGVVALNSTGAVVRNATVLGSDQWENGFMGVLAMYSEMVVENSTFHGGRDGVYTHYSDGVVVRDNVMTDQRFGVHEMYTSDALVVDNTVRRTSTGVVIMTRPVGNAVVGNDIRDSDIGVATAGSASFAARNVLVGNGVGLSIGTGRSYYARNTVVDNDVGVRSSTLLPTNTVTGNDVVANGRAVDMGGGTQNVWTEDGRGNYWGAVPGLDRDGDGIVDRSYRAANPVDAAALDSPGGHALAQSPAVRGLRQFQQAVPGLRRSSVVDTAPLADPVRPDVLETLNVTMEGAA